MVGNPARVALKKRLQDIIDGDHLAVKLMEETLHRARFLPEFDWLKRIQQNNPQTNAEIFLSHVATQVTARATGKEGPIPSRPRSFR